MQLAHLAQRCPGVPLRDFAHAVPGVVDHLVIVNEYRAKAQTEPDVVLCHVFLGGRRGRNVAAVGEAEVAVPVNIAGLGIGSFHLAHLPLIDDDAKIAEIVEIAGGRHHRVDAFRHFRGVELGRRAIFAAGQMPPELGRMVDLHLGEGVDGTVVNLLPGDGENGVVQIVVHKTALKQLRVGAEIQLLPI